MANEEALKVFEAAKMPVDSVEFFKLIDGFYTTLETSRIAGLQKQLDLDIKKLNTTVYIRLGMHQTFEKELIATIKAVYELKEDLEEQLDDAAASATSAAESASEAETSA